MGGGGGALLESQIDFRFLVVTIFKALKAFMFMFLCLLYEDGKVLFSSLLT